MNHGSHAELATGKADRTWHVPDGLSLEAAATVPSSSARPMTASSTPVACRPARRP